MPTQIQFNDKTTINRVEKQKQDLYHLAVLSSSWWIIDCLIVIWVYQHQIIFICKAEVDLCPLSTLEAN